MPKFIYRRHFSEQVLKISEKNVVFICQANGAVENLEYSLLVGQSCLTWEQSEKNQQNTATIIY